MGICEWRQDTDGFWYLLQDFRGADEAEVAHLVDAGAALLTERSAPRLLCLVEGLETSPEWLKGVKDANAAERRTDLRVAVVGPSRGQRSVAAALNLRAGQDRLAVFEEPKEALAWLRSV